LNQDDIKKIGKEIENFLKEEIPNPFYGWNTDRGL
jgi:hypothetical protein